MKPMQLSHIFALPIQAAVRAQNLSSQETLSFIEEFGIERGNAKTFKFNAERTVEERVVDPTTGNAEFKPQVKRFEVSVPLLAMISPPSVNLQEMQVEFALDILEPKLEMIKSLVEVTMIMMQGFLFLSV